MTIVLSATSIAQALKNLGNYRVVRAQEVAHSLAPLMFGVGLRETGLRNIEGGAILENGKWVFAPLDTGWVQISRRYHAEQLRRMPAVKAGTWGPVVEGHTPAEEGFCPRFEESLQFALREFHETRAWCMDHHIRGVERDKFTASAHNCGLYLAIKGLEQHGDSDYYTAHQDYGRWVVAQLPSIRAWLEAHPNWQP